MTLMAFVLMAATGPSMPRVSGVEFAQLTIQQRVVVRVPIAPVQAAPQSPVRWVERKGPKCVGLGNLAGFAVRGPQVVDLFMRGGQRIRTKLERGCSRVDLGYGFYVRPNSDGRICKNRDAIHTRTGGKCDVEQFSMLVPER